MHMFPYYVNDSGKGYIFSAQDCLCSHEDINATFDAGDISETYKNLLIGNLWSGDAGPNPAYFAAV